MSNTNLLSLLTKLSKVLLLNPNGKSPNGAAQSPKSTYKPVNNKKTEGFTPSIGGDFTTQSQSFISPKQSAIDMLNRHTSLSKRIDRQIGEGVEEGE